MVTITIRIDIVNGHRRRRQLHEIVAIVVTEMPVDLIMVLRVVVTRRRLRCKTDVASTTTIIDALIDTVIIMVVQTTMNGHRRVASSNRTEAVVGH